MIISWRKRTHGARRTTQGKGLTAHDARRKAKDSGRKTKDTRRKTQGKGLTTQGKGLTAHDARRKAKDSGRKTQGSCDFLHCAVHTSPCVVSRSPFVLLSYSPDLDFIRLYSIDEIPLLSLRKYLTSSSFI